MNNVVLIDGSWLLHRSINHPIFKKFHTTLGLPTGGVFGFLSTLQKLVKAYGHNIAVAWEGGGATRKRKIYEGYKSDRPQMPQQQEVPIDWKGPLVLPTNLTPENTFQLQKHLVQIIMKILGIANGYSAGNEADDVLATWALRLHTHPDITRILIYTLDHDLWQCVSNKCSIYYPGSSDKNDEREVTLAEVETKYGSPEGVLWAKILQGDKSDHIPAAEFKFPSVQKGQAKIQSLPPRIASATLKAKAKTFNDLLDVLSPKSSDDYRNSLFYGFPSFCFGPDTMNQLRRNLELISLQTDCKIEEVEPPAYLTSRLTSLPHVFAALEFKKFATQAELWSKIAKAPKSNFLGK